MVTKRALAKEGEKTEDQRRLEEAMNTIGMGEVLKDWKRRIFQQGYNFGEEQLAKQCGFPTATAMRIHFSTQDGPK